MTEEVMEAVAQQIGEPRPLRLKAVGSQRSHDATVKLATFLTDRNFIISELNWTGVISPPLNEPVELHRDELQGDELLVNVSA